MGKPLSNKDADIGNDADYASADIRNSGCLRSLRAGDDRCGEREIPARPGVRVFLTAAVPEKIGVRHPLRRDISWDMTAVIWPAYVLSEGDHRKVSAEAYIKGVKSTLCCLTGCEISVADFTDDSDITLTVIKTEDGRVTRHLTPLSEVQKEILKRAGLKPSLYKYLEINKSPPQLTEW